MPASVTLIVIGLLVAIIAWPSIGAALALIGLVLLVVELVGR